MLVKEQTFILCSHPVEHVPQNQDSILDTDLISAIF